MRWGRIVAAAAMLAALSRPAAASDDKAACLTVPKAGTRVETTFDRRRIEACTSALEDAATDAERIPLLFARSEAYYRSDSLALALIDLQTLEGMSASAPNIAYDRALNFSALGLFADSLDQIEVAIQAGLRLPQAYAVRGADKAFLGRYGEALEDLDLAISEDASSAYAFESRGFAELEMGENDRAIPDLSRAIALAPDFAMAFYYRGRAHFGLDQFDEALADFRAADRLKPGETAALEEIADVTGLMNMPAPPPEGAPPPNAPSRAVGRSHNCGAYYPYLAGRLHQGGDVMIHYDVSETGAVSGVGLERSSGDDSLDRAAVICVSSHWRNMPAYRDGAPLATPRHLAIIRFIPFPSTPTDLWRGRTLAGLGRYDEAEAEFTRVIGLDPSIADAYYRRGWSEFAARNYSAAAGDFEKAAKLKHDDTKAAEARDLVKATAIAKLRGHDGI